MMRYSREQQKELANCKLCPRECGVNRLKGEYGYCRSGAAMNISSICIHHGEEPVFGGEKGICNVFFAHCNLQCIYCQNHQISSNYSSLEGSIDTIEKAIEIICGQLSRGVDYLGFVSPSHCIPQMMLIIDEVHKKGLDPIIVYNTNSYDKKEQLRLLEGFVDIYLADYKYVDPALSESYSAAKDYPSVALRAIREMMHQKGDVLKTDSDGLALSGVIIRHLVLPGHSDNSIGVLDSIARELSPHISISLMSQYYPVQAVAKHPIISRVLRPEEYRKVVRHMESLGLDNGWIQEIESSGHYLPDFSEEEPFEQ